MQIILPESSRKNMVCRQETSETEKDNFVLVFEKKYAIFEAGNYIK